MINMQLAEEVLGYIEAHPEEHDQSWWGERNGCGTTMCFAGHAAVRSGATLIWPEKGQGNPDLAVYCIDKDGNQWHIETYAEKVLNLDFAQAQFLFYQCDSLEDLKQGIKGMGNGQAVHEIVREYNDRNGIEFD